MFISNKVGKLIGKFDFDILMHQKQVFKKRCCNFCHDSLLAVPFPFLPGRVELNREKTRKACLHVEKFFVSWYIIMPCLANFCLFHPPLFVFVAFPSFSPCSVLFYHFPLDPTSVFVQASWASLLNFLGAFPSKQRYGKQIHINTIIFVRCQNWLFV